MHEKLDDLIQCLERPFEQVGCACQSWRWKWYLVCLHGSIRLPEAFFDVMYQSIITAPWADPFDHETMVIRLVKKWEWPCFDTIESLFQTCLHFWTVYIFSQCYW